MPIRWRSDVDVAPGRIGLRHLDHRADDRVRRAQLVRGVGGEAALLVDRALHAIEHRVEGVGEVGELVARPGQRDAVVEVTVAGPACGIRDPIQRAQHDAGEQPAADEAEDHQQRHRPPGVADEHLDEVGAVRREPAARRR